MHYLEITAAIHVNKVVGRDGDNYVVDSMRFNPYYGVIHVPEIKVDPELNNVKTISEEEYNNILKRIGDIWDSYQKGFTNLYNDLNERFK